MHVFRRVQNGRPCRQLYNAEVPYLWNEVVSEKTPQIFFTYVACWVCDSVFKTNRRFWSELPTNGHTHRTTTITLAAHVCRGLINTFHRWCSSKVTYICTCIWKNVQLIYNFIAICHSLCNCVGWYVRTYVWVYHSTNIVSSMHVLGDSFMVTFEHFLQWNSLWQTATIQLDIISN